MFQNKQSPKNTTILHSIHIMYTYMPRCASVQIVSEKIIWQDFVMIKWIS